MKKEIFPVLEMSCASCAQSVESILKSQDGVKNASVNFANATSMVEFDPNKTSPEKLKSAVQSIGYDLVIEKGTDIDKKVSDLHKSQYAKLKINATGALIFSIPLFIIAMTPALMKQPWANVVMWLLATPVVFYFGRQFLIGAWKQLKHHSANMDTLVAMSTLCAYLFSVFNTLFPLFWLEKGIHTHVYFEASAVVIAFLLLGKLLEERAKGETSAAIKKLIGLQPKTVLKVMADGTEMEMSIESVKIGDLLIVKAGDKIAVDGKVVDGTGFVDESSMTGESVPVQKKQGDAVYAGTLNQNSTLKITAEKVGSTTMLAQIIKAVEEAQGSKAPIQKLVDKIAAVFVPVVICIAAVSMVIWGLLAKDNGWVLGLQAFITVLVIACPCALGLATPTALMAGIGTAASGGILIKDAESLERIKDINAIIFDKTGTITEGKPAVAEAQWWNGTAELKNILFSIERTSSHPLAKALTDFLVEDSKALESVTSENIAGRGIKASYQGRYYFIGNAAFLKANQITFPSDAEHWLESKSSEIGSLVLFGSDEQLHAAFIIKDKIKSTSIQAIQALKSENIEVYMLTGDNEQTAAAIAKEAGISDYQSQMLPSDKAAFIQKLQQQNKIVAMTGDGINDSNAMAVADVSIAMGKGSDIAMDVAQMTIVSSDLSKVAQAIALSRKTSRTIRQNLFWAFIYNIIGIPIAAGILYPVNGFLLNPMIAGAAMALSSVSVVTNSVLAFKRK